LTLRWQAASRVGGGSALVRQHYTFMNIEPLVVSVLAPAAILLLVLAIVILPRRIRMERHARELLAQHPGAEQTSVYLELHSTFSGGKQREIDAKIAEMQPQGWTFLRAMEASPLRTLRSWGGGLTLHFIRTKV
jgi:hypothetical protein